ncbi:phasin family protein [Rhodoblastus acidophilus]|uniref:Phasin family protein n=1 Tax=Candidatus Rhodoblastus alkanivorans TaxID=2954117 RepID=A0ABS9Z802_9HYPH|nr:phasin family protein [Candidatus Rhodoblastus alkanivorans]MCI4678948.1 phasin family protein [Candidatus Rhodoblastus alkanivorans]MCI4683726.1 phasin family protein [Candidatus Rhodoblastus alkanivorans]MDI4641044.1 phasin family protein [Rhodoblastus acidophilus]
MANTFEQQISTASADALSKSAQAADKIMKESSNTLTESGKGSAAAVQDLIKTYQELAARNVKNLTAAMEALSAVKSPAEFMELQQRLIKESVEAAVNDSRQIAQLTNAVFTAAFEPVKKQMEAAQKTTRT